MKNMPCARHLAIYICILDPQDLKLTEPGYSSGFKPSYSIWAAMSRSY